ncbi:DUF4309 domain-containing protein [Cytobacillus sp. FJAT-54145]|uniref:DUF4309 domain-containing protein n=1 Tax=Cytobacillus spartinae TaxID=3299023 RepID=A0ABW6KBZ1_9BACI
MKKILSFVLVTILFLSFGSYSNIEAASAPVGVKWGNSILIKGQIGKVTILKDTDLVKEEKGKLVTLRKLKKGSEFRVYSYKDQNGGIYGLGGGAFVKKSSSIKYETPSSTKKKQLERIVFFDSSFLDLASEGYMKGSDISLYYDDIYTVYDSFGYDPEWQGYFDGGYGRQFGNYIYFTGGKELSELTAIDWVNDGLTPLTPYIIRNTVGTPDEEGYSEMDGSWYMYYDLGYYSLQFVFQGDNKSDLSYILLK